MDLGLYRRLGFQEYCTFQAYFWQGATEESQMDGSGLSL